ncbi:plasmid pRiA4b ORF-3 family protein [Halomonas garicola]|uniref:plasmid pRiA4b ORF-3 family protein n=1 Tax=Halomonas garicola TaxID=1690008 RepID=UPI0028965964|nr:plasmid pRiA4b ORF-3 family protein [Halomonas garicola]
MADIRLRIELLNTDPLVWRRVVVPEQINLHRLHELIQDVMGWADCHLYEFECNGRYYGEPDEWSDLPIAQARNARLKAMAARVRDNAFHYLYDFGDGWEHRLIIEATELEKTDPCPRFIDGAMACPPEDIGGTVGYEALKAAAAGEQDEHGQELLEVLGGKFDPEALDEAEVADMLVPFQASFRRLGNAPSAIEAVTPSIWSRR